MVNVPCERLCDCIGSTDHVIARRVQNTLAGGMQPHMHDLSSSWQPTCALDFECTPVVEHVLHHCADVELYCVLYCSPSCVCRQVIRFVEAK